MQVKKPAQLAQVFVVVVAMAAATSCTASNPEETSTEESALARLPSTSGVQSANTDGGFDVVMDGARVAGGTGVADVNAVVRVVSTSRVPSASGAVVQIPTGGIDVDLTEGDQDVQPRSPITVEFVVDTATASRLNDKQVVPVVMTAGDDSDTLDLLSAEWDPVQNKITAGSSHLSTFWPAIVEPTKLHEPVTTALANALELRYPQPDCYGKDAVLGEFTYRSETLDPLVVYPSVSEQNGQLHLVVYSNSPMIYEIRTDPPAQPEIPSALSVNEIMIASFYRTLLQERPTDSVIVPGGSTGFTFDASTGPIAFQLRANPGLMLVAAVLYGIDVAASTFAAEGKLAELLNRAETLDCLLGVAQTGLAVGEDPATWVGSFVSTALDCLAAVAVGALAVIVGIFTSGLALVVGMLMGAVGPLINTDRPTVTINVLHRLPTVNALNTFPPPDPAMQVPPTEDPDVQPGLKPGAHLFGAPNLVAYCAQWSLKPVVRFENAWGLRCAETEGVVGNRIGDQNISMTAACALTFPGQKTIDHYIDYSKPDSWGCYLN